MGPRFPYGDCPMTSAAAPAHDFDLLCIGSGPAGQRAAVQAAKLRKRVAIIESEIDVGGVCLRTGTIPSKTFREAVLSFGKSRETLTTGLNGNGHLSNVERATAEKLLSRVAAIVQTETKIQRDQLFRNGIDVIPGMARFNGPHSVEVHSAAGVRQITAENLMIAVGTRAHKHTGLSGDQSCVITSDEILRLGELPRTAVVIGCGVIGIEYASMFAALGIKVTVIDGRERPLEFLDAEIVDELIHQLRKRMVTFRLGEKVKDIDTRDGGPPRQAIINLESGKRLVTDLVLACTGRVGASDTLNLASAGLSADERGRIKVDATFRSAVPHIFAAGDVIGYPSLAAISSEQGRLAACHAFGAPAGPMPAYFPIGVYSIDLPPSEWSKS